MEDTIYRVVMVDNGYESYEDFDSKDEAIHYAERVSEQHDDVAVYEITIEKDGYENVDMLWAKDDNWMDLKE